MHLSLEQKCTWKKTGISKKTKIRDSRVANPDVRENNILSG